MNKTTNSANVIIEFLGKSKDAYGQDERDIVNRYY